MNTTRVMGVAFLLVGLLSAVAPAAPVIIGPGDTLSVGFRFNSPYASTPDLLSWGFNTEYTGQHTHKLYDGNSLLGTFIQSSGGSISGYFKSAESTWPSPGTVVDFSRILDRSINGRIEFSISSGTVGFDPLASILDRPLAACRT